MYIYEIILLTVEFSITKIYNMEPYAQPFILIL